MKRTFLFTLALASVPFRSLALKPAIAHAAETTSTASSASADIAVVRDRYVASVLPAGPEAITDLHGQAAKDAATLKADGSWPDIDYTAAQRSDWVTSEHMERVLVMAKSARVYRNAGRPDTALESKTLLALQWWTDHDYRNPNWWWNEIGIPQLMGEVGNLMLPQIPSAELAKMVTIMRRSNWQKWTGANLTWGVAIQIARGCMQNDAAALTEGFTRMYQEIRIESQPQEGMQQDDSFHQHGTQLYNGGYGRDFAEYVGRFISYSWGTRFQIPADRMAIFSAYLLNGEQWMMRNNEFDYSTIGREITRVETPVTVQDQSKGPISPQGPAYGMAHMLEMLAAEPTPHQKELQAFAERTEGRTDAPPFTGNRQFWCSDYMTQRRKGYFTSIKMLSTRMRNAELVNSEGKKSVHLSDGANYLYLTGNEYINIFPVWDWTKIPGTTAIQGTLDTGEHNPISVRGTTTFDGGVSDGTYGIAAMDLARGNLTAKKAWFFFDHSYVALGAGITLASDTEHDVATDVNQPLLKGDVFTSEAHGPVPEGAEHYDSAKRVWVYHDHVGYAFAPHTKITLSAGPQSGRWSDIGTGSNELLTKNVFNLWIDHGRAPQNASYEYTVFPNVRESEVARIATSSTLKVLSNTSEIQAVYNRNLKLAEIAFRAPGSLATPLGKVKADHSCLLLVRQTGTGLKITASNPENEPLALHVTVKGKQATIQLPDGNFAGSSVSAEVQ